MLFIGVVTVVAACVPPGNSTPSDSGPAATTAPTNVVRPSGNVMTAPFEDNFDRPGTMPSLLDASTLTVGATSKDASVLADAGRALALGEAGKSEAGEVTRTEIPLVSKLPSDLGPNWNQVGTSLWHIENGRMCIAGARNHGVWLNKVLPVNARIEFDAETDTSDGDFKAEVWGDGVSAATSQSYTNATSYLAIVGGWKNTFHVLARINEHGADRQEIKIDKTSDDMKEKPVASGQTYHIKVERSDGKTVRMYVDGVEYLAYVDPAPLVGPGHDHFGFNAYWDHKVCYDNVRVTPMSPM